MYEQQINRAIATITKLDEGIASGVLKVSDPSWYRLENRLLLWGLRNGDASLLNEAAKHVAAIMEVSKLGKVGR